MSQGIDPSECLQAITGFLNTDGRTTIAQSHQYQQYLLSLRDHSMYATTLLIILGSDRIVENALDEDGIRVFCLTALHDWTKKWWPQMSPPQHLELRNSISSSIVSTISDSASTGYCSKCASLIVEIAERQFPEHWPSFVDDLLALWLNGSFNKQQTTLKTLHDLYTDCTDPDFTGQLSTIRRQEIISAMQPHHKQIIGLINEFLSTHLQQYLFNRGNTEYSNGALHIRSMILAIELMIEMATVIVMEDWLTCETNQADFVTLFYFALQIPEIQVLMATLLEKLCRHEMTKDGSEALVTSMLSFFNRKENATTASESSIFLTPLSEDEDDQIKYIATMATVMSGFLQSNWTMLETMMVKESQRNGNGIRLEVQQVIQNILRLVANPMSLKVAGESIMDIQKIFHGAKLYWCPVLSDSAGAILTAFFERAKRAIFIDDARLEAEPTWFTVEFEDDKEEYNEFFGTYISKCQLLLIEMIREVPMAVIAYIQEHFQVLQQMGQQAYAFCQTNQVSLSTSKQQQQQFQWYLKTIEKSGHILSRVVSVSLDQLVQLFGSDPSTTESTTPSTGGNSQKNKKRTPEEEQILQHERSQRYAYQQSIQNSVQFLAQLLSWPIPEDRGDFVPRLTSCLQKEQLRLLGGTSAMFTLPSFTRAILPEILTRLFQYVFLPDTNATSAQTSTIPTGFNPNMTGSVSDLAATTIASFLHRCAKHIEDMSLFDMILQTSSQLLTAEDTANSSSRETTKMAMCETLIVLSNFLPMNNPMKTQLITLATDDIVKRLLLIQSQLMSSVDQFVHVNQELMTSGKVHNERELISKWTSLLSPLRDGFVSFVQVTRKIDMSAMDAQVYRLLIEAFQQATEETTVFFTTVNHQNANSTINNTPVQMHAYLIKQLHKQYARLLSGNNSNAVNSLIATLSDPQQVVYLFPLAQAWFQVLTCIRQLLPVMVQLSLATTDHAAVTASNITNTLTPCIQQACHQAALSDICRLLNKKYQQSHLQGWELHEVWRNLWINVWKTLDMSCRQRIFYLWPDQATFVQSEVVWIALTNIPSHHLGRLLRYFVSGYLLNVIANPSAVSTTQYTTFLFHFLEILDGRLRSCWATVNESHATESSATRKVVLSAIDDDGLSSLGFGHAAASEDSLLPNTSDELNTLRDNRIRELMSQYADVLCELMGLKGPLCVDTSNASATTAANINNNLNNNLNNNNNKANNPKKNPKQPPFSSSMQSQHTKDTPTPLTNEDKKTARREYLRYLLFHTPLVLPDVSSASSFATLGQRLCATVSWLLTIPDAQVFKASLTMVNYLMEEIQRSYADVQVYETVWKHYETFFMRDVFLAVLRVLLLQENWSTGLGWDMVDYLLLILRMYVLVLPLDVPTTATTAAGITHSSQFNVPRQRSNVPLEQFVATGLVTPTEVDQLIQELSRGNSKKRQRAIVKDFVSLVMVAKIHDTSKLQLQGSEFAGHVPKVNTNATDDTARKKAKAKKSQSIAASLFASLTAVDAQDELTAGLFDDI